MKSINNYLCFILLGLLFYSSGWAIACPDIQKARLILKELKSTVAMDWCAKEINQEHLQWVQQTALPRIMTKSFLGVEPPENWPQYANELVLGCAVKGNLCLNDVQEQFIQCTMAKIPFILYQLGPWFDANCKKINHAVIEQWPARKPVVIDLITEYQTRFK